MPMRRWLVLLALSSTACGGAMSSGTTGSSPVTGSSPATSVALRFTDPVFDPSKLHEVRLELDPADWQALRDNYLTDQYYAADITIDGETVRQIGIRSRGVGSRNPEKPALKLDFNKYVAGQKFHGYSTVVLKNLFQDPSLMREKLSFAVFQAMGVEAPQLSHARLTVNGEYWGVFNLVEAVSKPFLKQRLGQDEGNLFNYEYDFHWDFSSLGTEPDAYIPIPFKPETNEDHLDPSGLVAFIQAINETPDPGFVAAMRNWFDVDRFLTYLAVENATAERDGMVGVEGVNNFYLYQYDGQNRFLFIPWDKDGCLAEAVVDAFLRVDENVLTQRLLADPTARQTYLAALRRAAGFVNARYLVPVVDDTYKQIRTSVLADPNKPITNQEFEDGILALKATIAAREADILAQVR
jgi:spore coat protein CotH